MTDLTKIDNKQSNCDFITKIDNKQSNCDFLTKIDIDLLSNPKNIKKDRKIIDPTTNIIKDDNDEILRLINDRMSLGRHRYGHGLIVNDDTTKYGTETNDWELMALEEMLDGMIYSTAAIIRYRRKKLAQKQYKN